jgi:hypothetical protein
LTPIPRRVKVNKVSIEQMNQGLAKSRYAVGLVAAAASALLLLVAAAPAGAVSRSFFGIVPSVTPGQAEFETMSEARVGSYRFVLDWAKVQPTQGGAYDWSEIDAEIANASQNGLELLPILYGSPGYASDSHRAPPLGSSEAKQGWQDFLSEAARRYGPGGEFWAANPGIDPQPITTWQVWNEQNSSSYYEPKPSPKEYAELLRLSDEALSDIDSSADILLGGMFATPGRRQSIYSWRFVKKLYKQKGAKRHFDAIALHPYSPNLAGIRDQIELVRKQLKKVGEAGTPLWITELGWGSAGTKEDELIKSQAGQKKMLKKAFNLFLDRRAKWDIKRLFWYTWRDPNNPSDPVGVVCKWCASAGLFDSNLDPKPAWEQFRKFTGAS